MATMKTLNGYGINATELNGKTSDNYLLRTDTASDSAKLGGKAPEYYLQPRNLLDNSFWRRGSEIVNQRGQTSYTDQVYGIDRWYGRANAQSVEVRNTDITVTATATAYVGIKQKIANIEEFAGETVTLAVYVYSTVGVAVGFTDADDNAISETVDSSTGARVILCTCTVPSNATPDTFIPRILLRTTAQNDYMRCYWAALYEGSYTADTLPPYVPKGYTAELAECQRYYYQSFSGSTAIGWDGAIIREAISVNRIADVSFPQTMRIEKPTITLYSPVSGNANKVSEYLSDTDIDAKAGYRSRYRFMLTREASEFEIGKHYSMHYTVSADL